MSVVTEKLRARSPWRIFVSVIKALFLREMGMRMSTGRSGLFWTFAEPFFQVAVFIGIRIAIVGHSGKTTPYDFAVFMASGFIAFNLFKNILNSSTGAFLANKGLFVYKQVKPIDTIFSRALVELFLTAMIVLIFLIVGLYARRQIVPEDFLLVVAGYLWLAFFAVGLGVLVATANTFYMSVGKVVSISSFLLMIFSAVFFPIESLPPVAQEILLYNPVVHFMEMIHAAYLPHLSNRFVDYGYMLEWTLVPWAVGLWYYVRLERKIISA